MVIKPSPAMKTPNAMLMAASIGSALFIVKVAVADGEGDVGTGAYITVTTVGLGSWQGAASSCLGSVRRG